MSDLTMQQFDGIWAIVPAGGSGSRYATGKDKLLVPIDGMPILAHTVLGLLSIPSIAGIMLVSSKDNQERYQTLIAQHVPAAQRVQFALGGPTRRDSVYNGLIALPESTQIVVVHDAARPLIRANLIEQAIQHVINGEPGAILAAPIHDTVKEAHYKSEDASEHPIISATLDRSRLWRAQTPQVFQYSLLLKAHRQIPLDTPVTDDAQLLELAGLGPVAIVPSDERNLKITRPIDVIMAETFLQAEKMPLL